MLSQENFGIKNCILKSKSDKEESIRKAVLANIKDIEILDLIYQTNDVAIYKFKFRNKNSLKIFTTKCRKNGQNKIKNRKYGPSSELSIHKKLKHNNIINLHGYYDLSSFSGTICDFYQYGDLHKFQKSFLKKRFLSETFLCYLAKQIIEAIKYIHKNKILHLDIKQNNILINDYLQFKLIDFSISLDYKNKQYIDLPRAGTFGYMSPEVINRETIKAKDASKIDIFSFGVLLYYSAFGELPYDLDNVNENNYSKMAENIKNNELEFPNDIKVSNMFKSFLKKCLEKNIENRYDIYDIVNDDWIKGSEIIKDYKECLCNTNIFLIDIIMDNILNFNIYIK